VSAHNDLIPFLIETPRFDRVFTAVWVKRTPALIRTPILAAHFHRRRLPRTHVTPMRKFLEWAPRNELDPGLFIFHIGRTGSTLLSQCFKQDETNLVLAEPPVFGGLHNYLEKKQHLSATYRRQIVRGVFNSFAATRHEKEERTVFKLSTLSNLHLPHITQAFRQTPLIFLQRNPYEVLASYCKGAPDYVRLPYKKLVGGVELNRDYVQYLIRHIEKLYENIAPHLDENCIVLDYKQIDVAAIRKLYERLNFTWSEKLERGICKTFRFYSKGGQKQRRFAGDKVNREILDLIAREKPLIRARLLPYYRHFSARLTL
jgi:hypothetical protein